MNHTRGLFLAAVVTGAALFPSEPARAAGGLESAEVTRVYNSVELLPPDQSAIKAKVGDDITGKTAVQTGGQSRAELQFNDLTLARLGANSVFSFERGTRDLNLNEGVILLEVPKDAGGATINTAAVTAAVTGTTVMIESQKGKKGRPGIVKFIVLEGTMRLKMKGRFGESILLGPGEMISMRAGAGKFPEANQVDVERLTKTSGLMSGEFEPLRNEPYIMQTMNKQRVLKAKGKLITVNYSLQGKSTNPLLQLINTNNQSSLRTDASVVNNDRSPRAARAATRSNTPPRVVRNPPAKPPVPPKQKPPKPPKQPPRPKPQPPVAPPPVPPSPPDNRD